MTETPSRTTSPRTHERHAWILLLIAGLPMLFGSIGHLATGIPLAAGLQFANSSLGMTWEQLVAESPAVAESITGFVRVMAIFGLGFFVLFTTVVATGYRRGERWAWYVAWTYSAAILGFSLVATVHDGWIEKELGWAGPGIAVVIVPILLGLLLPLRTFFPKANQGAAAA